jgi:CRISPR-associated protein Cmr2
MVTDRWSRKIVALLHDPPDKPFAISGHVERADALRQVALGRNVESDESDRAKRADHIASAADRVDFPEKDAQSEYLEAYWHKREAVLTHPLAGRALDLGMMADVSVADTHNAALRAVEQLMKDAADAQHRFLRLWRQLPDALAAEFTHVGKLFGMLPAETRQPDHPLHQHLSITAAIADALPHPALLVFSIGPVQEFIAAARRTQDLWMGSYLLSYLTWAALQSVAETYGPDTVVFPSLRGQPLCDLWLHGQGVSVKKPDGDDLALATLPNKFVALLPASEARAAAQAAAQAVRDRWQELTDRVFNALANGIMPADAVTRQMWQEQVKHQLEIYWAALPWAGADKKEGKEQAEAVKTQFEQPCQPPADWQFGRIYKLFAKPKAEGGGQYHPNWGTTYSLLYSLTDRAFNARKNLRDFEPTDERGEKCTVCGQRAALRGQDSSRAGVRDFWSQVANKLKAKKRFAEVKPNGRERLCAVCSVKRFVQREVLKDKLGTTGGFPSTSEVAVAGFKRDILANLSRPALFTALKLHVEYLKECGFEETIAEGAIPLLWKKFADVPAYARDVARSFLRFDGELFFAETFREKRLQDDYELSKQDAETAASILDETVRKFLDAAKEAGIPRPSKYYAILHMDGDHAGRWLSGTHEGLTCFGKVFHPKVQEELGKLDEWKDLLKARRLMTPALHAAISDALANFALNVVRWMVEERHTGRVVYAGGDDVLAFLPLDQALSAARELRALFSGEVALTDGDPKAKKSDVKQHNWRVAFGEERCTGYLWLDDRPLLTMGPTATASIGIAIAHHTQPLDAALQASRDAEHDAKELYNRNALCVYLLKRSGEEARVGAQWFYCVENGILDATALIDEVRRYFVQGVKDEKGLSMKFAQAVFDEARTLAGVDGAQQAELRRLILRHTVGFKREEQEERKRLADDLSVKFVRFASVLQRHREKWECDWRKKHGEREPLPADEATAPQPSIVQLARWLLLARFLAKGGEE